ncbi:MAG: glycosyltransferase family 4 protein [Lacibacter sp.]
MNLWRSIEAMKQSSNIKIFHFHNGAGGGVLSVIRNLLAYRQHPEIENHVIYTINRNQIPDYKVPGLAGAASEQVFYYSPKWNFYYTCRQLAKLLPDDKAVIVAHDWLELGMVSNLGLQNPVVHYVHGAYDYYYSLAVRHSPWVDCYITVAQHIADELLLRMPGRKENIHYLRFPVPDVKCSVFDKLPGFHLVFAGRCEEAKGYPLLPEIDRALTSRGIRVQWHIAGEGSQVKAKQAIWPSDSEVQFYGNIAHDNLMQLLCRSHALILPSQAEGMPVSVIEAMKASAVPVVNDLPGGIQELVLEDVTGFRISNNRPTLFADRLAMLIADGHLWQKISSAASSYASMNFSPEKNTSQIEDSFLSAYFKNKIKDAQKIYGSRLDHPAIPNMIVKTIRSFL